MWKRRRTFLQRRGFVEALVSRWCLDNQEGGRVLGGRAKEKTGGWPRRPEFLPGNVAHLSLCIFIVLRCMGPVRPAL